MPEATLSGTTAIVTGSSRGFGRQTAISLAAAGAHVVGVARGETDLKALQNQLGGSFDAEVADAADPAVAARLIDRYRPRTVVLNAGATPHIAPLHEQTWQTFATNWEADVRHAFNFLREALLAPLDPGSRVITVSSGAALRGSPLSGGYAGAKATIRFISSYAAAESERAALGISFVSVLPQLTPATALGAAAVAAYAARQGTDTAAYLAAAGPVLTAEQAGEAITSLATGPARDLDAYLLTAAGLAPAPGAQVP
jgi:NAD(P)-dependent dehydrogenase (short-subunit alcohol dehydrogenase family)